MTAVFFLLPFLTFANMVDANAEPEVESQVNANEGMADASQYAEYYQQSVSDGQATMPRKKANGSWLEFRATKKSRCDIGSSVAFAICMVAVASAVLSELEVEAASVGLEAVALW